MKITPLEIKKQQFKKVMRGYDSVEVDTFLDMIADELEDLLRRNKGYHEKLIELEVQLKDYKNMERALQETLKQAQAASDKSLENSRKEADLIVQEARLKASQIVEKARLDFARFKEEIVNLKARKESIISRLKVLLSSEVELLRALEIDDEEFLPRESEMEEQGGDVNVDDIIKEL